MAHERISAAELAILEILWTEAPLTATEVAERIVDAREWSLATVKTLLSRLVAKKAIAYRADGRRFQYSALVERNAYVAGESRRLVDRFFGGQLMPFVAHLAEHKKLTDDEIKEIERLIRVRTLVLPWR
jgi:BlaI family transcriptional regulator, penicillinase repressor